MRPQLNSGTLGGLPTLRPCYSMLIDDARWILAAWRDRLVDDDDVRTWSLGALDTIPPADSPDWLLDLCASGATTCMSKPSADFLHVPFLDFPSAFSLHVQTCNLADQTETDALVDWISRACMGEDLDRPEVRFGYLLDHDLNDCGRPDWARDRLDKELPALHPRLVPIPEKVLNLVRQSMARHRTHP